MTQTSNNSQNSAKNDHNQQEIKIS